MKRNLFEVIRIWIGYAGLALLPVHTVWILFEPVTGWEYGKFAISLTAIVWGIYVALSALTYANKIKISHAEWFFALLFFVAISSFTWFSGSYTYIAATHMLGFVIVLGIFAYAKDLFDSKKGWYALGVGVMFAVCVSIIQLATGFVFASTVFGIAAQSADTFASSIVFHAGEPMLRLYGSFAHPNIFAAWLGIGLIIVFAYRNRISAPIRYGLFGVLFILLLFTFSRGAVFGLGAFAVLYALLKKDFQSFIPFVLIVIGIGSAHGFLYSDMWADRFGLGNSFERNSVSERMDQYDMYVNVVAKHIPFGTGPGMYTVAVREVRPEIEGKYAQPVHNSWILFISEWGIVGLLILIAAAHVFAKSKPDATMIAYVCFIFITGLFDHYWITSFHLAASAAVGYVLMRRL